MRIGLRSSFVLLTSLALFAAAACGDDRSPRAFDMPIDGGPASIPIDAQAGDAERAVPTATMRIAHLAAGVGPVDFCYQGAKRGTLLGPVLGGGAAPSDAGLRDADDDAAPDASGDDLTGDEPAPADADVDAALPDADVDLPDVDASPEAGEAAPRPASFRTVSRYLALQASGPITLAVVPGGSSSCANVLATGDVTLDPGKLSTVALFARPADGGTSLSVAAFTDDHATTPDKIRVRVIHAALGGASAPETGAIAVRAVAAKTTVLADRVEPGRAATASAAVSVDALGYVTGGPVPGPSALAVGPSAGGDAGFAPWQSAAAELDLRGGSLHSAFVLGGDAEGTFAILWCADATTSDEQALCKLVR